MSARHQTSTTAAQARLRLILVAIAVLFLVFSLFFRGDSTPGDSTTTSGATSTSTPGGGDTTLPDGSSTTTTADPGSGLAPLQSVELRPIAEGIRQPIGITAPVGDDRLFVVQRGGFVRIIDANRNVVDTPFLDLTGKVLAGGIEQGLLGLAFHPQYATNGRVFAYFTVPGGSRRLSEFRVSAGDPNVALASTEKVLFEFPQPPNATDIRHYGGQLNFDPDGYLWVASGDGADSRAQGQDPNTPYGTVMRIDVDGGDPYGIPSDNPFASGGGKAEVWGYGLRNPWRFSFDPVDRMVYIGDVGHNTREEVNVVSLDTGGGSNFGWSDMEGDRCFHLTGCNPDDYTNPVIVYIHDGAGSVTGGYVYRGAEIPELHGVYFYGDWVQQWVKSFRYVNGEATEQKDWTEEWGGKIGQVTSFGLDGQGELYLATWEGKILKFTAVR